MDIIIICLTVVTVFAMISFVTYKFVIGLHFNNEQNKLIENLNAQVKKINERLGQLEVGGRRSI